jgi:hypothetical protein
MATHSNGGGQALDNYDIRRDYGPANWDVPHRFVASYVYDLPFLKDSPQPVLKYGVAGWQVSGVTTIQSGSPVNVTISGDRANIGISGLQRPDLIGAVPQLNCQPNSAGATAVERRQLVNCFDSSAFALPPQFTFGSASRNLLRGPKFVSTDLSFMKNLPIAADVKVQVRVEIFNLFNTVQLGLPDSNISNATAGTITSLAGDPRVMQFSLRVVF